MNAEGGLGITLSLHGIDDVIPVVDVPKLVFVGLDLSRRCNFRCLYCFARSGGADPNELTLDEKKNVLEQAKKLGAVSLVIAGAGEPLLDPDFQEVVRHAERLRLITIVYTNGTLIDEKMAGFLYSNNVSLIVKLESLKAEVHDSITTVRGSWKKAMDAISTLLLAGYDKQGGNLTRLGTLTVILKQNWEEIPEIVKWCVGKGIKPKADVLDIYGRADDNAELLKPTREQVLKVQGWMGGESLCPNFGACKVWKYGIVIGNTGDAKYCIERPTKGIGNIRDKDLERLVEIKNRKYPALAGADGFCPLKAVYYRKEPSATPKRRLIR